MPMVDAKVELKNQKLEPSKDKPKEFDPEASLQGVVERSSAEHVMPPERVTKPDVGKAIEVLELGVFDGAHHKDWCIQQALKHLYGLTDQELKDLLDTRGWEEGIPP